ncbi:MAG: hypothetical protein RL637_1747, partial [Pseudomonadota bacterium]
MFRGQFFIFLIKILIGLWLTSRLGLAIVEHSKPHLQTYLARSLGVPIQIGQLNIQFQGINPELSLTDIQLLSQKSVTDSALSLHEIRLHLDLWNAIKQGNWLAATSTRLIGTQFSVIYQQNGQLAIVGLPNHNGSANWLWQGLHYQLIHSQIVWIDAYHHRKPQIFSDVNILIDNQPKLQQHHLQLSMQLPKPYGQQLSVDLQLSGEMTTVNQLKGQVQLQAEGIKLAAFNTPLKALLPTPLMIHNGAANIQLTAHIHQGKLATIQAKLDLQQLQLQRQKYVYKLKKAYSDFVWLQQPSGWKLVINQLQIHPHSDISSLQFIYAKQNQWLISVQHVAIEPWIKIATFIFPESQILSNFMQNLKFHGKIKWAELTLNPEKHQFNLQADIRQFSVYNSLLNWKCSPIHFKLTANQNYASIHLAKQALQFTHPQLIQPVILSSIDTEVIWQRLSTGWQLLFDKAKINTNDLHSQHFLQLIQLANQPLSIAWQMRLLSPVAIKKLVNNIPPSWLAKQMSEQQFTLLNQSVEYGQIQQLFVSLKTD